VTTPIAPSVEQQTNYEPNLLNNRRNTSQGTTTIQRLENILVKQGKQIRALYLLQKSTNKKVTQIQSHLKKQNKTKNTDLSQKVFSVS
jgi:hypothetical protein